MVDGFTAEEAPVDDASCYGFVFTCFAADRRGRPKAVGTSARFQAAEAAFLSRMRGMLAGRPDLLRALSCQPEPMEVRLHDGRQFYDWEEQVHFYGRVTERGDGLLLELAVDQILEGCERPHAALDVVVHEMMHVLDYFDEEDDGELVGWDAEAFRRLRAAEQARLADGSSVLDPYGATNDIEFLAVLGESFFVEPARLKAASPGLYAVLAAYFRLDPAGGAAVLGGAPDCS